MRINAHAERLGTYRLAVVGVRCTRSACMPMFGSFSCAANECTRIRYLAQMCAASYERVLRARCVLVRTLIRRVNYIAHASSRVNYVCTRCHNLHLCVRVRSPFAR